MNRRGFAVIAAGLAVLLWTQAVGGLTEMISHFVVAQFSHGISAGKTIFLLVYGLVFMLRLTAASTVHGSSEWPALRVALVASVTGMAICFLSCLSYMRAWGLPIDGYSFAWCNGVNSVNCLVHIHTGKAAVAWLVNAFALGAMHTRFDTGLAYLHQVPLGMTVTMAACFVVTTLLSIWGGAFLVRAHTRAAQPLVALVSMFSLQSLSKSIVDGGPLAYDAVAAWMTIATLAAYTTSRDWVGALRRVRPFCLILAAGWLATLAWLDSSAVLSQLKYLSYRAFLYGALIAVVAWQESGQWRWAGVGAMASSTVAGLFMAAAVQRQLIPLLGAAPRSAVVFDLHRGEGSLPPHFTVCPVAEGTSYYGLYARLGERPNRVRRVSAPPVRSTEDLVLWVDAVVGGTPPQLYFPKSDLLRVRRIDTESALPVRIHLELAISAAMAPVFGEREDQIDENERFVTYYVVDSYLRAAGLREYVMVPYVEFRQVAPSAAGGFDRAVSGFRQAPATERGQGPVYLARMLPWLSIVKVTTKPFLNCSCSVSLETMTLLSGSARFCRSELSQRK